MCVAGAELRRHTVGFQETGLERVADWHDHLERPRNAHAWPAKTLHHMDREWLMRRRASLLSDNRSSGSCTAGRTNTRAFPGCVHMRWDDGVEFGRSQLV